MLLNKLQQLMFSKKSRLSTLFVYFLLSKFVVVLTNIRTLGLRKQYAKKSKPSLPKTSIYRFWLLIIIVVIKFLALLSLSTLSYAQATSVKTAVQAAIFAQETTAKNTLKITSDSPRAAQWNTIEKLGKNQPVYFHAWGGDPQINSYIQWLATRVKQLHNIDSVSYTHLRAHET